MNSHFSNYLKQTVSLLYIYIIYYIGLEKTTEAFRLESNQIKSEVNKDRIVKQGIKDEKQTLDTDWEIFRKMCVFDVDASEVYVKYNQDQSITFISEYDGCGTENKTNVENFGRLYTFRYFGFRGVTEWPPPLRSFNGTRDGG